MNTLIPFEATIRLGGLMRAAEELHVTHGAISRQLQTLEGSLGVELFERQGRKLVPTDAALVLGKQVQDALALIASAVRQTRPVVARGALVLSCEPTLMMKWLLQRLPSLNVAHPELELHLSAAGGPVDLHRTGIDAAIRRTDFDIAPSLESTELFAEWVGPVCSPEVAAEIHQPTDLAYAPRLVSATRAGAWATWAKLSDVELPEATTQQFEHFYLSLEAATAGLGVAIGPYALVKNDLDAGRLVAPLGFIPDGTSYVLLTSRGTTDSRVAQLSAWLSAQRVSSTPPRSFRRA
ncbi:hypothetical protein ASE16_02440 [Leifsonia sp. Root227]|uniref:LysR family transcriptional regulator n=1 Tax=Leifsonia sp. Root227 TaxID=1736496 RepID=UPI0006F54649|nr:LysR family transcriptional regulator [Leifsonia sp. Root227]KRC51946.1 hypothetical protein ASE16_02440 [Leifsonia sp. Root227]